MIERISHLTYEIRHNPNCPSPYCIVTCGDGGAIYPYYDRRNLHSFGKTLDDAVRECLRDIARYERKKREEMRDQDRLDRIFAAQSRVRGVVWA